MERIKENAWAKNITNLRDEESRILSERPKRLDRKSQALSYNAGSTLMPGPH